MRDGGPAARVAGLLAGAATFAITALQPPLPQRGFAGRHRALVHLATWLHRPAALSIAAALAAPFALAQPGAGPEAWALGAAAWTLKITVLTILAAALTARPTLAPMLLPAAAILAAIAVVLSGASGPA